MSSSRLLGGTAAAQRSILRAPRSAQLWHGSTNNALSRTRCTAPAAVRGFKTTRLALFKSDAADDDPGDYFDFAFVKRDHTAKGTTDKPTTATAATTTTTTSRLAAPSAAPFTAEANKLAENFGFLFDCDGVLHKGNQTISGAQEALRLCHDQATRYLFLTNGGGNTTEDQKAVSLKKKVGLKTGELVDGRVIQSHTPLSTFKEESKRNDTVYVTSLDPSRARDIANAYGFKNVVTAADLIQHYPDIFPFEPKMIDGHAEAQPLPNGTKIWRGGSLDFDEAELERGNHLRIDHIFVLNDPRDWALETQIIHDLLISHRGYLGTVSEFNGDRSSDNNGWQQDGQPQVWVSNLDLLWKTENPISRFGTGAFVHALRGVWAVASGGRELRFKYMGKPSQITYEYAHECLLRGTAAAAPGEEKKALRRVYMVGDNPESDVRGALEFHPQDGTEYVPILVRTGVWEETQAEPKPRVTPAVIVDDVLDAIVWAMRQEGIDVDREMVLPNRLSKD
ncbi:Phosphatidyl synthase [Geosmithia morbida]|uniref:Phosphatidyl synthase n=1 Tax=Geosmithia morbida TaxID=1094350 RepID=A0A9P4YZA8_9HYPO|nr:Phosphatidyl synthase [Geosmithia morbida]KAF4124408.1 Phosphatidyl synthase [Geosmithia morbida]